MLVAITQLARRWPIRSLTASAASLVGDCACLNDIWLT